MPERVKRGEETVGLKSLSEGTCLTTLNVPSESCCICGSAMSICLGCES